jgi:lipopolysaccharide biosynthesis glycosyltransferase
VSHSSSTSPRSVHIAFGCDRNVADGLAAVIASTERHLRNGWNLEVHILDCGLGEPVVAQLRAAFAALPRVRLEFIALPAERMQSFPQPFLKHLTHAAYARLFLHELLPTVDRVIYLDCDLLICGDLVELAEMDLGGVPLAAVRDRVITTFAHELDTLAADLPAVDPQSPYFNSGVLVLDLRRLRELDAAALYAQTFRQVKAKQADQSILNVVCLGRWKMLPAHWNRQILLGSFNVFADRRGGIWHFTSRIKPWLVRPTHTRGLVASWYRAIARVHWTPIAVPQTDIRAPWWRDAFKAARAWGKSLRNSSA